MPDMDLYEEDDEYDDYDVGELELIGDEDDEDDADDLEDLLDLIEGVDDDDDDYDDEDDEIGARGRRRRRIRRSRRRRAIDRMRRKRQSRRSRRSRRAMPARVVPTREPPVVRRQEDRDRTLMIGGRESQGAVAGQLLIPTTVQELARVDRLFVTGIDAAGNVLDPASYSIADIKVGTKSQFAALPPLPGVMFQADATGQGTRLGLDTIQTGTDFTVIIADAPAGSTFTWGAYAKALR